LADTTSAAGAQACNDATSVTTSAESEIAYLWELRHRVLYRARLNSLYLVERSRSLDRYERLAKVCALMVGSAAIAQALPDAVRVAIAAVCTLPTLASLVFTWGDRSRQYSALAKQFDELEASIASKGEREFSERDCSDWGAAERRLSASFPAPLMPVFMWAQNRLDVSMGHPPHAMRFSSRLIAALA
jgi:hypothetical protein